MINPEKIVVRKNVESIFRKDIDDNDVKKIHMELGSTLAAGAGNDIMKMLASKPNTYGRTLLILFPRNNLFCIRKLIFSCTLDKIISSNEKVKRKANTE
jgi:hypothetical protein